MSDNEIVFSAIIHKVQTLVDGGLRVTLDLPDNEIGQAAMLMECRRQCIPLNFSATADKTDEYNIIIGKKPVDP